MKVVERFILTLLLKYAPLGDHKMTETRDGQTYAPFCLRCKVAVRRETIASWR